MEEPEQTLFKNALTTIIKNKQFQGDGFKYNNVSIFNKDKEKLVKDEIENSIKEERRRLEQEFAAKQKQFEAQLTMDFTNKQTELEAERTRLQADITIKQTELEAERNRLQADFTVKQTELEAERAKLNDKIALLVNEEKDRLLAFQKDLLSKHIAHQLEAALKADEAANTNKMLSDKLTDANTKNEALEATNKSLLEQLKDLKNSNDVNQELSKTNDELNRQLQELTGEKAKLTAALDTQNTQITELTLKIDTINADLSKCKDDLLACKDALSTCKPDLLACKDDLSKCELELSTCKTDLSACQNKVFACETECRRIYAEAFIIQEAYRRHIIQLKSDIDNANNWNDKYKDIFNELLHINLEYAAYKDICNKQIEDLNQRLNDLNNKHIDDENALKDQLDKCKSVYNYKREYVEQFLIANALKQALETQRAAAAQPTPTPTPTPNIELNIQQQLNTALLQKQIKIIKAAYEAELKDHRKSDLAKQIQHKLDVEIQKSFYDSNIQALKDKLANIKDVYPNTTIELLHK